MTHLARCRKALLMLLAAGTSMNSLAANISSYPLEVLPAEHLHRIDPETGAGLLFLTTSPGRDLNLYFHEHSWLGDESVILFTSTRTNGGLMGYISATGELIRFHTPAGGLGNATAAARGNSLFATRGRSILELHLEIRPAAASSGTSRAIARERVICTLPDPGTGSATGKFLPDGSPSTALNPSCDGKFLALGLAGFSDPTRGPTIVKINIRSGKITPVCTLPLKPGYGGHVQWSRSNPSLLSFAGRGMANGDLAGPVPVNTRPDDYLGRAQRLWVVDVRNGIPKNIYVADEGELVTHESWWIDDQLLFCGGKASIPGPSILSHVKTVDVHTGLVRIVGAGAWWPDGKPSETARLNWWHAAGSPDGNWIAADNWHGDIMLFEGRTTRPRLLTAGHRTYGRGDHPHVGWDRKSRKVIFTSNLLGDPNVCVATIPSAGAK